MMCIICTGKNAPRTSCVMVIKAEQGCRVQLRSKRSALYILFNIVRGKHT